MTPSPAGRHVLGTLLLAAALSCPALGAAQTTESFTLRGKPQTLRVYGRRGGPPVVVSSGDGGWVHLAPHVADLLAQHGFFVVGLDSKAYLSSFTSGSTTLRTEDSPHDFAALASYAARSGGGKPILIGVSEGAGLSVLAASDGSAQSSFAGVIALGLGDLNELGWRWKDAIIYLTHGMPDEPTFSVAAVVSKVAPLPLAVINSTHDEYVPAAELRQLLDRAREPKRLWLVEAGDHRFSNNLAEFDRRLLEAIDWIRASVAR